MHGFPIETVLVFIVLSVGALWLDLHKHKDDHEISLKEASLWSVFWIFIAFVFAGYLYLRHGAETATLFVTGYALEKVLSVDNLFVIMAIFAWFQVPNKFQHRVLYWGIIGAIIFRLIFVALGSALIALDPWVEVGFAGIIAATAIMMLKAGDEDEDVDYSNHIAVRITRKFFPVKETIDNHDFFVKQQGSGYVDNFIVRFFNYLRGITNHKVTKSVWFATPLFLCLMVVELSDVIFAFDSVPAVIAVSKEPLIVYSAMMFAILGLRTMYFVLIALKNYLCHLEKAVIVLLFFIAGKLALNATNHIFHHGYKIEPTTSLIVVLVTLAIGIIASLAFPQKD